MAYQLSDIIDFTKDTLPELGEDNFVDLTTDLQEYIAMPNFFNEERITLDSGKSIQWNMLMNGSGNAENVGLHDTDEVNIQDGMQQATIDWRNTKTAATWEQHEFTANMGKRQIVNLIEERKFQSMQDQADRWESNLFGAPLASTDNLGWYGFSYWIAAGAGTTTITVTQGFNGTGTFYGDGTAISARGGLSSTTYPRHANYVDDYTAVTKDDLITKIDLAMYKTNFKPAFMQFRTSEYKVGTAPRRVMYVPYTVKRKVERVGEAQNENLGRDVIPYRNAVQVGGVPMVAASYLDSANPWEDADLQTKRYNPVLGIDLSRFKACIQDGWYMRQDGPKQHANQRNTIRVIWDTTGNFLCRCLRDHFLLTTSTSTLA